MNAEVSVVSVGEEYATKIVGESDEVMEMVLHLVYTATDIHAKRVGIAHANTLKAFAYALNEIAREEEYESDRQS